MTKLEKKVYYVHGPKREIQKRAPVTPSVADQRDGAERRRTNQKQKAEATANQNAEMAHPY